MRNNLNSQNSKKMRQLWRKIYVFLHTWFSWSMHPNMLQSCLVLVSTSGFHQNVLFIPTCFSNNKTILCFSACFQFEFVKQLTEKKGSTKYQKNLSRFRWFSACCFFFSKTNSRSLAPCFILAPWIKGAKDLEFVFDCYRIGSFSTLFYYSKLKVLTIQ